MNKLGSAIVFSWVCLCGAAVAEEPVTAEICMARLKAGNERFVTGKSTHQHFEKEWRKGLVKGQEPFAVIVGCSDSRVPIELVFDQGFGDLFIVRNAGNVLEADGLGSLEYAIVHLKTRLIVIMGHEGCGAISAALMSDEERAKEPIEHQAVLKMLDPAVEGLAGSGTGMERVNRGVEAGVRYSVEKLKQLETDRPEVAHYDFLVVGAVYELETGKVRFLE